MAEQAGWMTIEVGAALAGIQEPHREKKRLTVILMAAGALNNESPATVCKQDGTCDNTVWEGRWMKGHWKTGWKDMPDVAAALDVCKREALRWRDEETVRLGAHYAQERIRKIAMHAAKAPDALATVMLDTSQKGADRTNAAMKLIGLADPQASGAEGVYAPVGGSIENTQQVNLGDDAIDAAIERELARLAGTAQTGDVASAAEQADAID